MTTTPTPFFPTFAPSTSPLPVILLTEEPRQRQQNPRKLEIISLDTVNELKDEVIKLGGDSDAIEELSLIATERPTLSPVRSRLPSRSSGRSSRPVPSRQQNESPRLRSKTNNVQLGRSRTPPTRRPPPPPPTSPRTTPTSLFQTSFEGFEPDQPALVPRVVPTQATRQRVLSPQDLAEALISSPQTSRQRLVPSSPTSSSSSKQPEYEYEYYYDYLDDEEDNGHVADYDLVPLANKVMLRIINEPSSICCISGANWPGRTPTMLRCGCLPSSILLQEVCELLQKPRYGNHRQHLPMSIIPGI